MAMQHSIFEVTKIAVSLPGGRSLGAISQHAHARQAGRGVATNGQQLLRILLKQIQRQMAELTREVLVDKQEVHWLPLRSRKQASRAQTEIRAPRFEQWLNAVSLFEAANR
ncbi:hypothetical protein D9M71_504240 [compost metagenome]